MRIAVMHNLRTGGAARRLGGTLSALTEVPGVELREFTLAEAVRLGPAQPARFGGAPWAPRLPRAVRPPLRYLDLGGLVIDWTRAARAVRRWSPDVVLGSPCSRLTGAPAGLRSLPVPSLYYCDEPRRIDYETAAIVSTNPGTRVLYEPLRRGERRLDRAGIAAATALATNSRYTAAGIERAYGRTATVLTPPVADIFAPDAGDPGRIGGFVLSVGTMIPSKGHDRAIEAVAGLARPLGLTVVCPREEPAEQARLTALAARVGVALTIRVAVADVELASLYRHALATLYLARLEPLGLVSLESQACGTPVVVAAEGGLVETVRDGVGGFAVVREPEAVTAALERVIALGPSLRISTREQPVLRRRDDGAQVLAVLRELAAERPAGGWRR